MNINKKLNYMKISLIITLYYNLFNIISCEEILIQININRPINIISNKYVSFSIDPKIISESMGSNNSQIIDHMASQLSPAYLKISGESFFKITSVLSNNIEIEDDAKDNKPEDLLKNFNDWISSVGWKPIIPLPYSPIHWDSMEALRILNISSALGIKNCIWQLGIDFNATGATNYVADLITLQTMVGAFQDYVDDWRIIGADISAGSSPEETKLYADLVKNIVEAIGWMPTTNGQLTTDNLQTVHEKDLALKNLLSSKLSTWLSLPMKNDKYKNLDGCSVFCVTEGLQWAQLLGDTAKNGFKIIYKPITVNDFNEPNLNYYISLLFKRNMGEKVFDAKIIGTDRYVTRVYSHCSKDKSGGISIMSVNMAETSSKILIKYSTKSTGSELWQYIITINNGNIMLNDEQVYLNSTLDPFIKIKHPNRPISITLPPKSIGFWVLPNANHDECIFNTEKSNSDKSLSPFTFASSSEEQLRKSPRTRTSSDKLLQELIMRNAAAAAKRPFKREKRHAIIKKDSNYLKQQLSENHISYSDLEHKDLSMRNKRFILKNEKPKGLENLLDVHELFDGNAISDGQKNIIKRNFPAVQIKKLNVLKTSGKRFKRQALPLMPLRKPGFRGRFPLGRNMLKAVNAAAAAASAAAAALDSANHLSVATPTAPVNPTGTTTTTANTLDMDLENIQNSEESPQLEDKIFEKKTNMNLQNLPNGDVHFKLSRVDGDYDYVEFDEDQNGQSDQKKARHHDAPDDESFRNIPTAFHESYHIQKVIPRENAYHNGEIWEAVTKPDLQSLDANSVSNIKHFPDDQQIDFITRELEPTFNQNTAGLRQAQEQLRSYYMQTLDSKEQPLSLMTRYNTPGTYSQRPSHVHQHHVYNNNHADDDDYSLNSQESFYHNRNSHVQLPVPMPTVSTTATHTTGRYPSTNLRWKRSTSCEKCLFTIKGKLPTKCKCNIHEDNLSHNHIERLPSSSHLRRKRNAVLKSFSWALSNEVNVIPKEMNNDRNNDNNLNDHIIYRRIIPYGIPKNYRISMRPHNYNDIHKWIPASASSSSFPNNNNLYNVENFNNYNERTSNTEKRHIIADNTKIENSLNESNSDEKSPKFMRMFSEKVSSFMDMINHHVSGWWNTWA